MTSAMAMLARSLRGGWRERAACRPGSGIDPELFYPVYSIGSVHSAQVTRAKAVCDGSRRWCDGRTFALPRGGATA